MAVMEMVETKTEVACRRPIRRQASWNAMRGERLEMRNRDVCYENYVLNFFVHVLEINDWEDAITVHFFVDILLGIIGS